ncbi:1900_t:CDS:1, partial [Racocetra persica]
QQFSYKKDKNIAKNDYENTSDDIALFNLVNISTILASSQLSNIGKNVAENGYESTSNDNHNDIALSNLVNTAILTSLQLSNIGNTLSNLEINITSAIS